MIRTVEENLPVHVCWIGLKGPDTDGLMLQNALVHERDVNRGLMQLPGALADLGLRAVIAAPLHAEGELLGVLLTARREPDSFSSGECEFVRQLGEHVAVAMRQGQLHESLRAAYDELRLTQQAVLRQERLSALGQMASGIAHDINNAISPASLYVERLLESNPSRRWKPKHLM